MLSIMPDKRIKNPSEELIRKVKSGQYVSTFNPYVKPVNIVDGLTGSCKK